jgi:hypothetical protein
MATNEDGHYGKYSGNSRHSRVTSHNFAATRRDDQAHMQYLKEDIDYDNKHGHSDIDMTADEKHISKLAGDLKYDDKHHGAARHTSAHSTEEYMARKDKAIKANAGPAQSKDQSLSFGVNANREKPTQDNEDPRVNYSANVNYSPIPRFDVSANANSNNSYGFGLKGRSKSGQTNWGAQFNRENGATNVSADATFRF